MSCPRDRSPAPLKIFRGECGPSLRRSPSTDDTTSMIARRGRRRQGADKAKTHSNAPAARSMATGSVAAGRSVLSNTVIGAKTRLCEPAFAGNRPARQGYRTSPALALRHRCPRCPCTQRAKIFQRGSLARAYTARRQEAAMSIASRTAPGAAPSRVPPPHTSSPPGRGRKVPPQG